MRMTSRPGALALSALLGLAATGCHNTPYIDTKKPVPRNPVASSMAVSTEDDAVKLANFTDGGNFTGNLPMQLPKLAPPRTTTNPEADQIWPLTLQEAIQIGLNNSEIVRVISLGAQGIPVGGFEPTPLNTGAGAGVSSSLGAGTLSSVYDPAIQETQIAQALSAFDTQFTTSLLYGKSQTPVNNGFQAGVNSTGARFPIIFIQDQSQFQTGLQKRLATGAVAQIQHNINYVYSNSPGNVFPSVYNTNLQLQFTQPLLGGTAQNPSGLEANRAPIVIARLNADAAVWNFKAAVMAHVRSIEQQYWALSQQQIQLWSREVAVQLGEEVVRRERAELEVGKATSADVAEAVERLERFKLALVTATSDVITTERQLRNILGLPPADNRRIIPVTAPTEARLEPDYETCLAQMLSFQPDIVQQQLLVRLSELQLLLARNQLLPQLNLNLLYQFNGLGQSLDKAEATMTGATLRAIDPGRAARERAAGLNGGPNNFSNFTQWQVGFTYQQTLGFRQATASVRAAQYQLLRQRAFLQQIVHQTTHSLYRFLLEVDANYKQFRTAQNLRKAAQQRLEATRAFYVEGRITIDRVLDAVSQYADAIAQEAQFKTSYNTSIAALEEAKGTLLAYDNVAVNEGPQPRKAYIQAQDQRAAHGQIHIGRDGPQLPARVNGPPVADPVTPMGPPGVNDLNPKAPFPSPVGPVGPPPTPVSPMVPAGEPDILSSKLPPLPASQPRSETIAGTPNMLGGNKGIDIGGRPGPGVEAEVTRTGGGNPAPKPNVEPLRDIPMDLPPLPK